MIETNYGASTRTFSKEGINVCSMMFSTMTMTCTSILMSVLVFGVAQSVRIHPTYSEVGSNITEQKVILPCLYTTTSDDGVQIEWYKQHLEIDEPIMRVNTLDIMTVEGNFSGRVERGDSASLVLLKPRETDSGTYKCEVSITSDKPNVDVGTVKLTVKHVDCQHKDPCGKCSNNMPQQYGPITIITCIWLVPLISCVVIMTVGLYKLKSHVQQGGQGGSHKFLRIYCFAGILLIAAFGLCLASIICIVIYATSGCHSSPKDSYQMGGYISGALGIAVSIFSVIGYFLLKRKYHPANGLRADGDKDPEEIEGSLQLIHSNTGHNIHPHELGSLSTKLDNPSDSKVNSMTVCCDNILYICTDKQVYRSEIGCAKFDPIDIGTNEKDLFMATLAKNNLIISIRSKTRMNKCKLEFYDLSTGKSNTVKLEFSSYCPWVCVGRDDQLYVTDYDTGKLYKVTRSGATRQRIGDGILETPTCVTQNSSGHVIVTDSARNDVCIFDEGGRFVTSLKFNVPLEVEHQWNGPHRVVLNSNNELFIACAFSLTIFVFTEEFRYKKALCPAGKPIGHPWSLLVAGNEKMNLYVAFDDCIRIFPQESKSNIVKDNRTEKNLDQPRKTSDTQVITNCL